MSRLKATRAKRSFHPELGELSFLGEHGLVARYFYSYQRMNVKGDSGWGAFNDMSFALYRVFGRENLVHLSEGVLITEELEESVRNPHGLLRNRLSRIERAFLDKIEHKAPLTKEELGIPEGGPWWF